MIFPDAPANPQTTTDLARAIHKIQATQTVCIPEVTTLPTSPRPNQILVHNNSGTRHVKWYNPSTSLWVQLD